MLEADMWWQKVFPCSGTVYFGRPLPTHAEDFHDLSKNGITVQKVNAAAGALWQMHLEHPLWGKAELAAIRDIPTPPAELIHFSQMTPADRVAAMQAKSETRLVLHHQGGSVLRERKNLLRFLDAVAGGDAVIVLDDKAQKIWSLTALHD